jgi:hypothetical protein
MAFTFIALGRLLPSGRLARPTYFDALEDSRRARHAVPLPSGGMGVCRANDFLVRERAAHKCLRS